MNNKNKLKCRFCGENTFEVINLGCLPLANALPLTTSEFVDTFPTILYVCSNCATAQLGHCSDQYALYSEYVYITPESSMLSEHYQKISYYLQANHYLNSESKVLEIGSNIGRFLKYLKPYVNSVIGVDPAKNIAFMANQLGVPTINQFFNKETAKAIAEYYPLMDLIIARHCFAHNEKPWQMLEGVAQLLSPEGVFVIENAYFPDTVKKREFDQIYHEHMYYYNLRSIQQISKKYGFKLIDCLHSPVHGGTMLYIVKHANAKGSTSLSLKLLQYLELEKNAHKKSYYSAFVQSIQQNKIQLKKLLQKLRDAGKTIHVYGASAKSVTLLNHFGIDSAFVPYAVDSTVTKHGKYIPLTHIKIITEDDAKLNPPDYYLLTIWNYKQEIINKVRQWGNHKTKFIIPHPQMKIIEEPTPILDSKYLGDLKV